MGGKERKEVLKLGSWEDGKRGKKLRMRNIKLQMNPGPFVMGWMNPAHLRWAWMNVKI